MKERPNTTKAKILSIFASVTLILFISGASLAYFIAGGGETSILNYTVTTGANDALVFSFDNDIAFEIGEEDFLASSGNVVGTANVNALLRTSSATTVTYNLYINIEENTFVYTQNSSTPEILLRITDPNGNLVTTTANISTLSSVTDNNGNTQRGFDITGYEGLFTVAEDYEIATTASNQKVSQSWKIEILFVNLDADQTGNRGKGLNSRIRISTTAYKASAVTYDNEEEKYTSCEDLKCVLDELYNKV